MTAAAMAASVAPSSTYKIVSPARPASASFYLLAIPATSLHRYRYIFVRENKTNNPCALPWPWPEKSSVLSSFPRGLSNKPSIIAADIPEDGMSQIITLGPFGGGLQLKPDVSPTRARYSYSSSESSKVQRAPIKARPRPLATRPHT